MYSCRLSIGIAKHLAGTNFIREHISRLKICYRNIAYTIKRKHKCSSSCFKFGEFIDKDNIAMLFLLTAFALESKCKNTNSFETDKIKINSPTAYAAGEI